MRDDHAETEVGPPTVVRVTVALVLGVILAWSGAVFAQDATPASVTPADLRITITETGFDLRAATIPAGPVRLTVEDEARDTRLTGAHAADEWVDLDSVVLCAETLLAAAAQWCA